MKETFYLTLKINKMKIRTQYNQKGVARNNQVFTQPSMTIPGQSMTVGEAIARFTMGLPVKGGKIPIWEGDTEIYPDLDTMDLVERDEYVRQSKDKLDLYNKQVQDRIKAKQKAYEEKIEAEIKRQVSQRSAALPPEVAK